MPEFSSKWVSFSGKRPSMPVAKVAKAPSATFATPLVGRSGEILGPRTCPAMTGAAGTLPGKYQLCLACGVVRSCKICGGCRRRRPDNLLLGSYFTEKSGHPTVISLDYSVSCLDFRLAAVGSLTNINCGCMKIPVPSMMKYSARPWERGTAWSGYCGRSLAIKVVSWGRSKLAQTMRRCSATGVWWTPGRHPCGNSPWRLPLGCRLLPKSGNANDETEVPLSLQGGA